jgi:hypothetical protein
MRARADGNKNRHGSVEVLHVPPPSCVRAALTAERSREVFSESRMFAAGKQCEEMPVSIATLRRIHLYLGCVFAPLLCFFAISGIWQTLNLYTAPLRLLSTIHMGKRLKAASGPSTLTSPAIKWLIVAMSVSLVVTIILGVVLAFKLGHRRTALICLGAGILMPLLLVVGRFVV